MITGYEVVRCMSDKRLPDSPQQPLLRTPIADRTRRPHRTSGSSPRQLSSLEAASVGNRHHHEHGHIISTVAHERTQGQVKPLVLARSDSARIEQIMRSNLVEFTAQVERYTSPASVLDALDEAIAEDVSLMVLGAKRFSVNLRNYDALKVGENVFIHNSVPKGW